MVVVIIVGLSAILVGLHYSDRGGTTRETHTKMHPKAGSRKPAKPKNANGSRDTVWDKLFNKARR